MLPWRDMCAVTILHEEASRVLIPAVFVCQQVLRDALGTGSANGESIERFFQQEVICDVGPSNDDRNWDAFGLC
jgi:hypothetical protein